MGIYSKCYNRAEGSPFLQIMFEVSEVNKQLSLGLLGLYVCHEVMHM